MSMSETTTQDEDFNPYDAELHELKVKDTTKKLSQNQKDHLLLATIDSDGRYRVPAINDDRIYNAVERKGLIVGRTVTDFGAEVIERLFQSEHGKSVAQVRALEQAHVKGLKMKRLIKAMKLRRRVEAIAPLLEGLTFSTYVSRKGYVDTDAVTHMTDGLNDYAGYRDPSEPTIQLTLTQLEQIAQRLK